MRKRRDLGRLAFRTTKISLSFGREPRKECFWSVLQAVKSKNQIKKSIFHALSFLPERRAAHG